MKDTKALGQYFTPEFVAEFMVGLARSPKTGAVLEPSSGEGIFLKILEEQGFCDLLGYEIDSDLEMVSRAPVVFESFVSAEFSKRFNLVIGNPPYVRWKNLGEEQKIELEGNPLWQKYFSSLSDFLCIFVLKAVELLKPGGELIYITPEYWFNTKHARALRDYLVEEGDFTDIIHFNETPIFKGVASSFVIFRYVRGKTPGQHIRVTKYLGRTRLTKARLDKIQLGEEDAQVSYFSREQFGVGSRWTLAPVGVEKTMKALETACGKGGASRIGEKRRHYATLGDIAEIGNGMVSGLDKAFQLPAGIELTEEEEVATIKVLKAKHMHQYGYGELTKYMLLPNSVDSEKQLKTEYPAFYKQLLPFKARLLERYSYSRDIRYWDWVFMRNQKLFGRSQERIFIPCKERISHKRHFRFALIPAGIFPTQDVTGILLKEGVPESPEFVLAWLNSEAVFEWLTHKGVVKGNIVEFSEKPLASIPMRLIDWEDPEEVGWHDRISQLSSQMVQNSSPSTQDELEIAVSELLAK